MKDDRLISLNAAIDAVCRHGTELERRGITVLAVANHKQATVDLLEALPSAQPDLDEWCDDCKEYDKERHCCPRWNRVIRQTVEDMEAEQPGWIPCSERLPADEEAVIVSIRDDSGDNTLDYSSSGWYAAAGEFWVVDNEANMRVVAWMPLPTPYREGDRNE